MNSGEPRLVRDHTGAALVTAFDAFGGLIDNPSEALLATIDDANTHIHAAVLPTSYRRSWSTMRRLMSRHAPSAIVMFGYAQDTRGLRIERYATNADTSQSLDNDGKMGSAAIDAKAPATLETTTPVRDILSLLSPSDSPVTLSTSAGGFVCNHVYFKTLAWARKSVPNVPCVFVHVGRWSESQEAPGTLADAKRLVAHVSSLGLARGL